MSSYSDFANKTRSSKMVLCHINPKQRLSVFALDSGTIYKKTVNYFVSNVKEDGASLTQASSSSLSPGQWYYDPATSLLYINCTDSLDPKTHIIIVDYKLFFSSSPIDLPHDLSTGEEVNYEGRLISNSPVRKELDDEQIGIVLETSSNIRLENTDGYFDEIYDTLIFENASVDIYSWSEILPLSEKKKIFSGIIQDKSFSESSITFNCKDQLYTLREPVQAETFQISDGTVPERYLYTPKRQVFGQHNQLRCVPIDSILEGYQLTGTVSGSAGSTTLTGTGTDFLDECSPGDQLLFDDGNQTITLNVSFVLNNTTIYLAEELSTNINGTIINKPQRPWRKKNRNWHIAGHKLRAPSTTVSEQIDSRRFKLTDPSDFLDGDLIEIGGTSAFISTIVDDLVTLSAVFQGGAPTVGTAVTKNPVRRAFLNGVEIFIDRDFTISNTFTDCILQLENTAEFNITGAIDINETVNFTNSSRSIVINNADYTGILQPRDWIRSDDISHATWYEISSVSYDDTTGDTTIGVRTSYGGATTSTNAQRKNPNLTDDNAIVTVNCVGKETSSGVWVKTASDLVKELLESDASITAINTSSFSEAKIEAPYIISYVTPRQIGGSIKSIKEVISDINNSVFGSLTIDGDQNFKYEVLSPKKPTDITTLKDDDILGISSIKSKNEIVRKVNAKYRFFSDKFTGDESNLLYEYTNNFVDNLIGSSRELNVELFLYNLADATVIAQRYAFFNSLSQSIITIKGKLNLGELNLNDRVNLELERLYKRYGGGDRKKIGMLNKISNDGVNVTIEINDLSNSYNRAANIAANTANDFSGASSDEKLINGYICDNNTETPDVADDSNIGQNLIC